MGTGVDKDEPHLTLHGDAIALDSGCTWSAAEPEGSRQQRFSDNRNSKPSFELQPYTLASQGLQSDANVHF